MQYFISINRKGNRRRLAIDEKTSFLACGIFRSFSMLRYFSAETMRQLLFSFRFEQRARTVLSSHEE